MAREDSNVSRRRRSRAALRQGRFGRLLFPDRELDVGRLITNARPGVLTTCGVGSSGCTAPGNRIESRRTATASAELAKAYPPAAAGIAAARQLAVESLLSVVTAKEDSLGFSTTLGRCRRTAS
jgi:hypothetical protein